VGDLYNVFTIEGHDFEALGLLGVKEAPIYRSFLRGARCPVLGQVADKSVSRQASRHNATTPARGQ
jgi:hypothetical protein